MAYALRPTSLLPAIKCTSCGADIQIAQMADHVCAPTEEDIVPSPPPPPPPAKDNANSAASFFSGGLMSTVKAANLFKSARGAPPPVIDSAAANKPFLGSSQDSPNSGRRSPRLGNLQKSATSPMISPRMRPFETPSPKINNTDHSYQEFPSRPKDNAEDRPSFFTKWNREVRERSPEEDRFVPLSPRSVGGPNVLNRMDNVALGPFSGRKGSNVGEQGQRSPSLPTNSVANWSKNTSPPEKMGKVFHSKSASIASSRSSRYSNGYSLPGGPKDHVVPPVPPKADAYDRYAEDTRRGHNNPASDESRSQNRSRTPTRQEERENFRDRSRGPSARRPSPPRPMNNMSSQNMRNEERGAFREPPKLRDKIFNDTLHTPSDSGSSDGSYSAFDSRSTSSVSTAPSLYSNASRKPSRVEAPAVPAENERPSNGEVEHGPKEVDNTSGGIWGGFASSAKNLIWNPSGNASRPDESDSVSVPIMALRKEERRPESPMDPAIQMGMFSGSKPTARPRNKVNEREKLKVKEPSGAPAMPKVPPIPSEFKRKDTTVRRAVTTRRGNCRGCNMEITGKSVKDADGRLTGRYHKECFVCKTCRAPFPTADFYVFENSPYCERHYHRLNNSLCKSCDRGIEGQYLETDRDEKFHQRCFTCSHCRVPLRDDYFELGGSVYCERHALVAARQNSKLLPPGKRNPERRKTRMIMM